MARLKEEAPAKPSEEAVRLDSSRQELQGDHTGKEPGVRPEGGGRETAG